MTSDVSRKTRPRAVVNLRSLTSNPDEPLQDIMQRATSALSGLDTKGSVEIQLTGEQATDCYFLQVAPSGVTLLNEPVKATLVATMPADLFRRIVQGMHSPQKAYLDGALKLRGDVELARQIIRKLAASGTADSVCPNLTFKGYDPVRGLGALKLHGDGFTPLGPVQLFYDYGGDTPVFSGDMSADSNGSFDVEQFGIPCGDLFGDPNAGVIVTANDLQSGQFTQQKFRTPC